MRLVRCGPLLTCTGRDPKVSFRQADPKIDLMCVRSRWRSVEWCLEFPRSKHPNRQLRVVNRQAHHNLPSPWFLTTLTAFSAHGLRACCIPLPAVGFVSFPVFQSLPVGCPTLCSLRDLPRDVSTLRSFPLISSCNDVTTVLFLLAVPRGLRLPGLDLEKCPGLLLPQQAEGPPNRGSKGPCQSTLRSRAALQPPKMLDQRSTLSVSRVSLVPCPPLPNPMLPS